MTREWKVIGSYSSLAKNISFSELLDLDIIGPPIDTASNDNSSRLKKAALKVQWGINMIEK